MPSTPELLHQGKVRDIYELPDDRLAIVASDRISAFDVVMEETIPGKGRVLTEMTNFWNNQFPEVPNHVAEFELDELPPDLQVDYWAGRLTVAKKAEMLPIECIVRGYLTGSAWKEYRQYGTVHGEEIAPRLRESEELSFPIFTPSTKSEHGHDVNISFKEATEIDGLDEEIVSEVELLSLAMYHAARVIALEKGIIIADTKFEFGWIDGELVVCDEVLTPDSSRFWPADQVVVGQTPPSLDKQPLRDYLETTGWDKTAPAPNLPEDIVIETSERYKRIAQLLMR